MGIFKNFGKKQPTKAEAEPMTPEREFTKAFGVVPKMEEMPPLDMNAGPEAKEQYRVKLSKIAVLNELKSLYVEKGQGIDVIKREINEQQMLHKLPDEFWDALEAKADKLPNKVDPRDLLAQRIQAVVVHVLSDMSDRERNQVSKLCRDIAYANPSHKLNLHQVTKTMSDISNSSAVNEYGLSNNMCGKISQVLNEQSCKLLIDSYQSDLAKRQEVNEAPRSTKNR